MTAAPRMTSGELEDRYHTACEVAREAGALARRFFEDVTSLAVESKGVQDLVSVADREVERLIKTRIGARFPTDQLIGEESGGRGGEAAWVIDPIDGTTNFLRGIPSYAISIGFVARGQIEVGTIYDPSRDDLYAARRGAGATLNGKSIHVRHATGLSNMVMSLGFSHGSPLPEFVAIMAEILTRRGEFRRVGSAALGLAQVAAGRFDAFWQMYLHSWDVVAGLLLVTEAGGRTNDFLANDGLEKGNETLAAAPEIYDEMARIVGLAR